MKLCSNGSDSTNNNTSSEDDYLHQLECLNTSVAEWITQHVQHNPLVDLTPIFRDYEAYLTSLDQKRKQFNNPVTKDTSVTTTLPISTETTHNDNEVVISNKSSSSDHMISGDHVISSIAPAISTTGIISSVVYCYHGNSYSGRCVTR